MIRASKMFWMGERVWTLLDFGKHKGLTLPQVIVKDPDWFFWAVENRVFKWRERLTHEARELEWKARRIKIPDNQGRQKVAEYIFHGLTGKFFRLRIVNRYAPEYQGSGETLRRDFIDMGIPRAYCRYDKVGGKSLLSC